MNKFNSNDLALVRRYITARMLELAGQQANAQKRHDALIAQHKAYEITIEALGADDGDA